ncbi:MAG TPA: M23 family metallopeptidase [Bacteroidota bacterium]|nr:M23 family metallopeptidase [Bacteroidota bacterium]
MAENRSHHITKEKKYEILVIPEGDAGARRSYVLTGKGIFGLLSGLVVLVLALAILLLGFTPLGALVPASNAEIQKRYGNQLFDLQSRLSKLSEEVIVIREYNLKLRAALGEDLTKDTTSAVAAANEEESAQPQADSVAETPVSVEQPARSAEVVEGFSSPRPVATKSFQASFPLYPPVLGYVSRGFDDAQRHFGIDYAARRGSIVSAAADGYVVFSGWTYEDGNMVIISHGGGYFTIYKHNQSLLKSANDFVKRGQPIALLGNSGNTSYGPHLHFELWKDGQPQNPDEYLVATESL